MAASVMRTISAVANLIYCDTQNCVTRVYDTTTGRFIVVSTSCSSRGHPTTDPDITIVYRTGKCDMSQNKLISDCIGIRQGRRTERFCHSQNNEGRTQSRYHFKILIKYDW